VQLVPGDQVAHAVFHVPLCHVERSRDIWTAIDYAIPLQPDPSARLRFGRDDTLSTHITKNGEKSAPRFVVEQVCGEQPF